MANKSGNLGTQAETAVKHAFTRAGFRAKRLRTHGNKDVGDLDLGYDEIVVEVKGGKAAESASDGQVVEWLKETEVERVNAGAQVGVLIMKRKGIGYGRAEKWWAVCTMATFLTLLSRWPGTVYGPRDPDTPVRVHVDTIADMLRSYVRGLDTPTEATRE